ncbi:MAG TPA: carboxypeptidase-like regulatory domain-containing protein, partial [Nitrospiria bacterium]|nr:carboxypeptidase-like regulatory domain-containing protein [Nitrospiria bacterium]
DCEFLPFVTIVRQGSEMTVVNEDPLIHNSQVYQADKGNVILNVPVPPNQTDTHLIKFQKNRRIFQMICGFHEFMQVWGYRVENPYNDLSDENGRFSIDRIPPGTYKVQAWHPQFKKMTRKITVKPGQKVALNFEFDASEVVRPNYVTQEKFRIGPKGEKTFR